MKIVLRPSLTLYFSLAFCTFFSPGILFAQNQDSLYVVQHYNKFEYQIPMRDGVTLFTAVYTPKDSSTDYPILFARTPYTIAPYGSTNFKSSLGPSDHFTKEGYIFVYQDVRGRFMSGGNFVNMTPFIPNKKDSTDVDESSDAFDSIEWLIKNIRHNNGKVGIWGISYPGYYAAMSAINAHPNLVAVSPQAPIANWFVGDDMHHNGALSLLMSFDFFSVFGIPRSGLTTQWPAGFKAPSPDAYTFFKNLGPLKNADEKYFKKSIPFWTDIFSHETYDDFWKSRTTLAHFKNTAPAILTVGGWYDSEDLYGTLKTFQTIEQSNPKQFNALVMGPWFHHGWPTETGDSFGDISFGVKTGEFYRDSVEFPFFNYYLKGKGNWHFPKALVFETGTNKWESFSAYPPENTEAQKLYFQSRGKLGFNENNSEKDEFDEYISDPAKPVPYTAKHVDSRGFYYRFWMNEDQRFAAERPDVLVYESDPLDTNFTIIGEIEAEFYASTSGTDADWVVKLIDVYPDDAKNPSPNPKSIEMGGYQMMLRGDIFRGKFRNSYEKPEPFVPGQPTKIKMTMPDVSHSFLKGHKIMVQIQSSWFPFFDMNPQKFCNIYRAGTEDFQKATQRIYHSAKYPSFLTVHRLK